MSVFNFGLAGARSHIPILPSGARVAMIGDSIVQHGVTSASAGGPLSSVDLGEIIHAQSLDPRFRHDVWINTTDDYTTSRFYGGASWGVTGDTVTSPGPSYNAGGMVGRYQANVVARKPDICVVAGGTNAPTAANNFAGLQSICSGLLAAGIKVVLCTVRPWSANRSGDSASFQNATLALNANIRTYAASTPGITLCDLAAAYGCPGPTWSYATSGFINTTDGLHPAQPGAYAGGKALLAALQSLILPGNYYAGLFASGTNRLPTATALLSGGTAGSKGTNETGQLATGLTCYPSSFNSAAAFSLVANAATGGMSQQVVITPSGTNTSEYVPLQVTTNATVTPGTYYVGVAEVQFDAWPSWAGAYLTIAEVPAASTKAANALALSSATLPMAVDTTQPRRWLITPPWLATSTATAVRTALSAYFIPNGATGTGTFKLHRWGVFPVADPHTAWNS